MSCATLSNLPLPPENRNGWPWTEESSQLPATMTDGLPWPKITIVTPSFNQGQFIEETIRSVLLQGYPNLEYIIIDGGSTDDTVQMIEKYEPWLTYWTSEPDSGQSHAINKGFQEGTGAILAWLNSDDIYCPEALNLVAVSLSQNPKSLILCGDCLLSDSQGKIIGCKKPPELTPKHFLEGGNVPGQPAIFFRQELLKLAGNLNESLHYLLDLEFWLRISLILSKDGTITLDKVLAKARLWPQAKTTIAGIQAIEERKQILDNFFAVNPSYTDEKRLYARSYGNLYRRYTILHWQQKQYLLFLISIFKLVYFKVLFLL